MATPVVPCDSAHPGNTDGDFLEGSADGWTRQFTTEALAMSPLARHCSKELRKEVTIDFRKDASIPFLQDSPKSLPEEPLQAELESGSLRPPVAACLLCIVTIIWGAQHAIIRSVLRHSDALDVAVMNLLRFALGSCCFMPWLPFRSGSDMERLEWRGGSELGIFQFLGFGLQAVGLMYTTAQRSCLLLYLNVKFVPIFSFFIFGHNVSISTWVSAAVALLGTVLLIGGGSRDRDESVPPNVGDMLSVMAAASSALFIIRLGDYAPNTRGRALNAVSMLCVTSLCCPWIVALAAFSGSSDSSARWSQVAASAEHLICEHWLEMVYLGVVTTAFTSWLQTIAQRSVPASSAAIIYALDPVWGCLFAHALLGESLTWIGCFGMMLLLGAVLVQLVAAAFKLDSGA